jgi:hypothetical protein
MSSHKDLLEDDAELASFEAWLQKELRTQLPQDDGFSTTVLAKIRNDHTLIPARNHTLTQFSWALGLLVTSLMLCQNLAHADALDSMTQLAKNWVLTCALLTSCWQLQNEFGND